MDHGCDSFIMCFTCYIYSQAICLEREYCVIVTIIVGLGFLMKTYEQLVLGAMNLGRINPVDEGILLLITILLFSVITGSSSYESRIFSFKLN